MQGSTSFIDVFKKSEVKGERVGAPVSYVKRIAGPAASVDRFDWFLHRNSSWWYVS